MSIIPEAIQDLLDKLDASNPDCSLSSKREPLAVPVLGLWADQSREFVRSSSQAIVLPYNRSQVGIVYVLNRLQLILRLEAGLTHLPEGERPFVSELVSPLGEAGSHSMAGIIIDAQEHRAAAARGGLHPCGHL